VTQLDECPVTGVCACGASFPRVSVGRPRKYCSATCRSRHSNARKRGVCRNCEREFEHVAGNARFCLDCRYKARVIPERGRALLVVDGQDALRCSRCSEVRMVDCFPENPQYKHGRATWCKLCYAEYRLDRRTVAREQERFSKYAITPEAQRNLWESQEGRCAACSLEFTDAGDADLDHDHRTGRVRAFLCPPCNRIVGHCGEDVDHLVAVAEYLISQRSKQ
jgi:recombination endonuclease VII